MLDNSLTACISIPVDVPVANCFFLPSELDFKYAVEKVITLKPTRLGQKYMICHEVAVWYWANCFFICEEGIRYGDVLRI